MRQILSTNIYRSLYMQISIDLMHFSLMIFFFSTSISSHSAQLQPTRCTASNGESRRIDFCTFAFIAYFFQCFYFIIAVNVNVLCAKENEIRVTTFRRIELRHNRRKKEKKNAQIDSLTSRICLLYWFMCAVWLPENWTNLEIVFPNTYGTY